MSESGFVHFFSFLTCYTQFSPNFMSRSAIKMHKKIAKKQRNVNQMKISVWEGINILHINLLHFHWFLYVPHCKVDVEHQCQSLCMVQGTWKLGPWFSFTRNVFESPLLMTLGEAGLWQSQWQSLRLFLQKQTYPCYLMAYYYRHLPVTSPTVTYQITFRCGCATT